MQRVRQRVRAAIGILAAVLALLGFGLVFGAAHAAPSCAIPADLVAPHAEGASDRDVSRTVPIGGYTLATFWMPQHCKQAIGGIGAIDCARPEVHAAGLTLHGLWPDGEGHDWPQWCKPAAVLPMATLGAHYCATPSTQQLQHEWAKHGTCMAGYTPDLYFDRAEKLYRAIHVSDLRALSYRDQTVASVKQAIVAANPGLRADSFRLKLDRRGWLEEIWFCLDPNFHARACAAAPNAATDADKVLIWRGGRARSDYNRRYGARDYGRSRYGSDRYGDAGYDRYRRYDRGQGYNRYRAYSRDGS